MLLQPGAGGEAGWVGGIKKTKGSPERVEGSNDPGELSDTWKCQKMEDNVNVDQSGGMQEYEKYIYYHELERKVLISEGVLQNQ